MYERHFGLTERPFELTANPRYVFLTETYREALSTLTYGLSARKGMLVMTGEAGTGKTTMLAVARAGLQPNQLVAYLSNPTLTRPEFLQFMTSRLGLPAHVAESKPRFLDAFTDLLERRADADLLTALVIDEAHSLPDELLEEVRLLANIERPDEKLLTVVLVGQPELAVRLNAPSLRQLKQRIALRCDLRPLTLREAAAYIAKRIERAGGESGQLFTREAVVAIHSFSAGIPRTINVICDNALLAAFASDVRQVSHQMVLDVARDFDLQPRAPGPESVAPPEVSGPASTAAPRPRAAPDRVPVAPAAGATLRSPDTVFELRPATVLSATPDAPDAADRPRSMWSSLQFWRR